MTQKNFDSVHNFLFRLLNRIGSRWHLSLMLSVSLVACSPPIDDETQLRREIEHLAKAIEQQGEDVLEPDGLHLNGRG